MRKSIMEADLKIGAVFSLAPDDNSPPTPDETQDDTGAPMDAADDTTRSTRDTLDADSSAYDALSCLYATRSTDQEVVTSADDTGECTDGPVYTEMTADDCEVPVSIGNEADDVITGTDLEMNSNTEVNDLEIDVETGVVNTETVFSPNASTDNPPELPMEGHVGTLSSVFPEGIEEALPPPILSPVMSEAVKVKEEPIEYDAAYEWTPLPPSRTEDFKTYPTPKSTYRCTKIYPCYIVLTDVAPLIGKSSHASYRCLRSLRKTECPNMCKKMHFRRRLKAGRNVFDVKTPSYTEKRLKHFETIGEDRLSPKSNSEYTKLKPPQPQEKPPGRVTYPNMIMTKAGVKYSFDEYVENVKTEISSLKQKKIELEEEKVRLQVQKEKEELQEKERLRKEREFKEQLRILSDQIHIKRGENFHKKEMRKKKQEYLKPGVSARSGRVRKPNSLLGNDLFAFNSSDIEGFKKLNALQEKQRKVLAEMKLRENRAKRVNRVVVHPSKVTHKVSKANLKIAESLKGVLADKPDKQKGLDITDFEIDDPEKEDIVSKVVRDEKKAKKKRKLADEASETVKKKPRKYRTNTKSDHVLIGDFPDTENVMQILQEEMKKSGRPFKSIISQSPIPSETTGTEDTSLAYPHARSLLNASKEDDKPEIGKISPDLMKGVKYLDHAKQGEAVRFQVGSKQLMMAKCGEKIVFYSPAALQKQMTLQKQIGSVNNAKKKKTESKNDTEQITIKSEPGVPASSTATIPFVISTLSTNKLSNTGAKAVISGMYATQTNAQSKLPIVRSTLNDLLNPVSNVGFVQTSMIPSVISVPFPLVSVPSAGANFTTVPSTQAPVVNTAVTKPTFIVNPAISRSMYAAFAGIPSVIPQLATSVSTSIVSTAAPTSLVSTIALPIATVTLSSLGSKSGLSSVATAAISGVNGSESLASGSSNLTQTFAILSNHTSPNAIIRPALVPATNAFTQLTQSVSSVSQCLPKASSSTCATSTVNQHKYVPISTVKTNAIVSSQSTFTAKSSSTAQSQSTANAKKGKFYLLKVDGKHILIPVPDASTPNAPVQTKAYLVNETPVTTGQLTKGNLTPIPTQTVNMPLPAKSVNNTQAQKTVPVLKRVNSQPAQNLIGPLSPQNVNVTKPAMTNYMPITNQTASTIAAQSVRAKVLPKVTPGVSSPGVSKPVTSTAPQRVMQTTPTSTQVFSYKLVTGYPAPGGGPQSVCKETSAQMSVTSLIPNTLTSKAPIAIHNAKSPHSSDVHAVTSLIPGTLPSKAPIVVGARSTEKTTTRFMALGPGKQNATTSTLTCPPGLRPVISYGAIPARPVVTKVVTVTPATKQNVIVTVAHTGKHNVVQFTHSTHVTDSKESKTPGTTICAKSLLTGATVTTRPTPGIIQPTILTLQTQPTMSTKVNGHEPSKSKSISAQKQSYNDKTINEVINLDHKDEKTETVKEDTKPQPFVANREERLKKLKELIKQKNAAVDQIRQNLSKVCTDDNEAKDTYDVDG